MTKENPSNLAAAETVKVDFLELSIGSLSPEARAALNARLRAAARTAVELAATPAKSEFMEPAGSLFEALGEHTRAAISPEWINHLFQTKLAGAKVEIPTDHLAELAAAREGVDTAEVATECDKIAEACDDNGKPILTQVPQYFATLELATYCDISGNEKEYSAGERVPLNFKNLQQIVEKAKNAGAEIKSVFLGSHLTEGSINRLPNGELAAYPSRCIEGSKSKSIDDQIKHRETKLGKGYEITGDAYFALYFQYLNADESLFSNYYVRFDGERDRDGDPLSANSYSGGLSLSGSDGDSDSGSGIGASREFPKR